MIYLLIFTAAFAVTNIERENQILAQENAQLMQQIESAVGETDLATENQILAEENSKIMNQIEVAIGVVNNAQIGVLKTEAETLRAENAELMAQIESAMDEEASVGMFAVIFGRPACPYCNRAKENAELLKWKRDDFNYRYVDIIAEGISKADLGRTIGRPVETVPQIFIDETHIGGYSEFEAYAKTHLGLYDQESELALGAKKKKKKNNNSRKNYNKDEATEQPEGLPKCFNPTDTCMKAQSDPSAEVMCACMGDQAPDCKISDEMGTAGEILAKNCGCNLGSETCLKAQTDPGAEVVCACMRELAPGCQVGDMGTAGDVLANHCSETESSSSPQETESSSSPQETESSSKPPQELPECKCPSYENGAVTGSEMCDFNERNCALYSAFTEKGCPGSGVHCKLNLAKPETSETPEEGGSEEGSESCCSKSWQGEGEDFCTMDDFIAESVPQCGKCLFDQQCEGFQEAFNNRPDQNYATGLVYCCPDAKRCLDRRPGKTIGCDSRLEVASCGYGRSGKCGPRMAHQAGYPKNCADVGCTNPNFPRTWMEDMSCPATRTLSLEQNLLAQLKGVDTKEYFDALTVGFACIGAASLVYFGIRTMKNIATRNRGFQKIEEEV